MLLDLYFYVFFFWSLCCLSFFDIQILINPWVSSNSSLIFFFYSLNWDRVSYHNLPTFRSCHVSECLPYHITCRYNLQKFTCKYYHFHIMIQKKIYAILRLKGKQEKMEDMRNNTF